MFRHGICIFVCVRHAWVELKVSIAGWMCPEMVTNFRYLLMGRAHERLDSFVICNIQDLNDGVYILKLKRLRTRFFFRHMIDTEELIVAENNSLKSHTFSSCWRASER